MDKSQKYSTKITKIYYFLNKLITLLISAPNFKALYYKQFIAKQIIYEALNF